MIKYLVLILTLTCFSVQSQLNIHPDLIKRLDASLKPFYHGVASGDPGQNSLLIWTKLTLDKSIDQAQIKWEVATDIEFKSIVQKGVATVGVETDFVLKTEVSNLKEGRKYFYRFNHENVYSIIGEGKTLPSNPNNIQIAFGSCSNYEYGFFNAYRLMANNEEVDLFVHLGDYIYEYEAGGYGDTSMHRINVPAHEIVSLDDYRTRYSLYRLDPDLRLAHQKKTFITTWDDHETADNSYDGGANNHQDSLEGDWWTRKNAATQAYFEWLPITDNKENRLYRSFDLGGLLNLVILDTRIEGRDLQVDSMEAINYLDSSRTILGEEQYDWLHNELLKENTWKIIGNQVPIGPMFFPDSIAKRKYMDGWDGYPVERERFLNFVKDSVENMIVVTGDYHRSFAFENDVVGTKDTLDNSSVEFVVTSISSPNDDEYYSDDLVKLYTNRRYSNNPHLKYNDNVNHGYFVLDISKNQVLASFIYVDTVKELSKKKGSEVQFLIRSGSKVLKGYKSTIQW